MENIKSNEDITDITEVLEKRKSIIHYYERNKMEVKEKSLQEEITRMTPEERKSFLHFFGRELTKNPPKTLEEEETERRVRLVFGMCGLDWQEK